MNYRFLTIPAIAIAGVVAPLATTPLIAQSGSNYTTPRTPWGDPDLQGTYSNRTITPFERAANVNGREFFTREEAAALEQRAQQQNGDEGRSKGTRGDVERAYNDFWWDRGTTVTSLRTSLVIDPPDGRVPPQTQEAKLRAAEEGKRPAYRGGGAAGGRGTDSWLDRSTFERCITRGMPGAMSPSAYNNNYRITQSPGYVAIEIEMLGGTRVIPTDGRKHVSTRIRNWMGDSVGRWEGNTLVVDTTNFTDKLLYRGAAEHLHLVERFTRVAPDRIDYRVTIEDPTTFTRPWTMAIPFVVTGEGIFEYACHEGNYGMEGILSGAREEERAALKGKQ
ncbi:MAG: hypothetical protein ACRD3G_18155 [Vicinamibacterales bacterium]